MKNIKKFILPAITVFFLVLIFVFSKNKQKSETAFQERKDKINLAAEWLDSKKAIEELNARLQQDPTDATSAIQLAQAYIQEGRVSGNHSFYDKKALDVLENVLLQQPNNFEALCCKATVLLSQHHFSEALALAEKAVKINPENAFVYGILCDAHVELGNYSKAVQCADKMVSIRPDIRSYSRVSYLREIYGDISGAISAAKLAVDAGYPGLEQTEWIRCVLAHLYENVGELDSAAIQYKIAITERPGYSYALAGLGNIERSKGNIKEALRYFETAQTTMDEVSFNEQIADLYMLTGSNDKAAAEYKKVIANLANEEPSEEEKGHGHYADKELAEVYLKVSDNENALKHALTEYMRRPANIDVNATLAWVYYKRGDYMTADKFMSIAMRTQSNNAEWLYKQGLIKSQLTDKLAGKMLRVKALQLNPFLDKQLVKEEGSLIASK